MDTKQYCKNLIKFLTVGLSSQEASKNFMRYVRKIKSAKKQVYYDQKRNKR